MKTKPETETEAAASVRRAVHSLDHDAILVANAGAGKTFLLVEHYFALLESGLEPRHIVAFTFTEKAANELKERIVARLRSHPGFEGLPEELLSGWRSKILAAPIGTIHQYCLKILEASRSAGERASFKIVDEALEAALQETSLRSYLRRRFEASDPDALLLLQHYGIADLGKILEKYLSFQPLDPQEADALPAPESLESELLEAIARLGRPLWEEIQAQKSRRHWMSFADMERKALDLIHRPPEPLKNFLKPVAHLLVDEFQDTAPIQIRLIEALRELAKSERRPLHLFCVGDPKQSIYRFRDVDRNLLQKTETEILQNGGEKFDFTVNWRSTPTVLGLVNAYARQAFPEAKDSQAQREDLAASRANLIVSPESEDLNSELWSQAEAKQVADAIQIASQDLPLERVAVLYRASGSAYALIRELQGRRIPYSVRGGQNLFERQEILDLHRLIYFLADTKDDLSLVGLLRSPLFLLSDATLYFLTQEKYEASLWEHLQNPKTQESLRLGYPQEMEKFTWALQRLRRLISLANSLSAHRLIEDYLRQEDWGSLYAQAYQAPQPLLAIEQWLDWLRNLEEDDAPLRLQETAKILREVSELLPNKTPLGDLVASKGSVQLLTIHAAKGLQFDSVFLIGMGRPPRGDYPLLQRIGNTLALKLPDPGKKTRRSERYDAIEKLHAEEEREEAKRLLYVAMTRAENKLWVWLQPKKARSGSLQEILLSCLGAASDAWQRSAPELPALSPPTPGSKLERLSSALAPSNPLLPWKETSVSELETFSLCPLRHHFAYERRVPTAPAVLGESLDATERGTLLHRALNLLQLRPQDDTREILRSLLFEAGVEPVEAAVEELAAPLQDYLASAGYARIQNAEEDLSELPFMLELKSGSLRGQIDRLIKHRGGWTLIDFKYAGRGHSAKKLLESYGFQLKTYALASRRLLQQALNGIEIHVLNHSECHEFHFSEEELDAHQAQLEALASSLAEGGQILSEIRWRPACQACPYHTSLPLCPVPQGRSFDLDS